MMIKKIKNVSGLSKLWAGMEIEDGQTYEIDENEAFQFAEDPDFNQDLIDFNAEVYNDTFLIEGQDNAVSFLKNKYAPSLAVDLNSVDFSISDDSWTTIQSERVIWDIHNNYDAVSNNYIIPVDQICSFDLRATIKDMINVKSVEIAIFKRESPVDDYWFIVDREIVGTQSVLYMGGATFFDFYAGEEYTVKIKLEKEAPGVACSAKIEGSDDYTAWGFNVSRLL